MCCVLIFGIWTSRSFQIGLLLDVVSSPASTLSCAPLLLQLWREAPVSENLLADVYVEN